MISVFAGEDDGIFGVGRGFESFDATVVGDLGFLDGLELVFQAGTDGADIGLNPNQSRSIAGGAQNLGELAAVFLVSLPPSRTRVEPVLAISETKSKMNWRERL